MYDVNAVNPFKIMVPVELPQLVGLVKVEIPIAGVGFTTTIVDTVTDGQFNVAE